MEKVKETTPPQNKILAFILFHSVAKEQESGWETVQSQIFKKSLLLRKERRGKVCGGFLYLIVFLTSSSEEEGKVFGF